jgi:mevalonate kinase
MNTIKSETYHSKLLLFGEYGLMYDAMALSMPFKNFSGFLDFDVNQSNQESTKEIRKFCEHLKSDQSGQILNFLIDIESLENDLADGLFFNSNIPQQYGVGSSGALVAALFGKYADFSDHENELNPELLKADFAVLEGYFHGRSSGLDPLTSFLNQALLIDSTKRIHTVQVDFSQIGIALLDTKNTGATGPLVQQFIEQMNIPEYKKAFNTHFLPANNNCIESLLDTSNSRFFESLEMLIKFQLQYFRRMIPLDYHTMISTALNENVFIKLLGSGGGGFLIAFAESTMVLDRWAKKEGIKLLKVE